QLKSLHFINCFGVKLHVFQPLLDITTPLKIKSLTLKSTRADNALIQLLIQKIGAYLENLFIDFIRYSLELSDYIEALDYIINDCKNIKFLYLLNIEPCSSKAF